MGGMGGVFRDHKGDWIMGYQHSSPSSSPLQAELEALKEGFSIILTHGYTPPVVETDATKVIKILYSNCVPYNSTIVNCKWLMHQLKQPKINHNFREGNKVAHRMAKEALKHARKHQLFDNPVPFVLNNLAMDKNGYVYLVKNISTNVCCSLAETGNLNVLEACNFVDDVTVGTP
ncbi:PREDICTED: uncharacterized protein LOC109244217 [Nicotiana attenuata]|uniref:uncharacterized protein LOC109244217 n=1 Tax=Nicotiana attenuata TaxID=49451 RepID=UPI000905430A|nr:PREDICTED: uncharacterized protein LOC109244217 [Nicotiana attenuata]